MAPIVLSQAAPSMVMAARKISFTLIFNFYSTGMNFMDVKKRMWSALTALVLCLPLMAQAGDEWAHKKKLSFDTSASGVELKEAATQLPMLVRLHSGNFTFADAKPDGSDLRFFAGDDKTALKFHIEQFDAANELAIVWVQMPKLSANAKSDALWMHWGNPKATPESNAKATYDAAQVLVLHFSEGGAVKDASANANDAKESNVKPVTAGPIGNAAAFDGAATVQIAPSASLKLTGAGGFSFSAWVKPSGNENGSGSLYLQRDGARTLALGLLDGKLTATLDAAKATATTALKAGIWQHVAVVAGNGQLSFYIDGQEVGKSTFAMTDIAGSLSLGDKFSGEMDEITLANTARTDSYVKAMALSQIADSAISSFDEKEETAEISYAAILLGAVTIDGWVVIGLLIVMAIISFWVMITKTISIGKINKANSAFITSFANKSDQLLTPGHAEIAQLAANPEMKQSSIYHLYAIGLREVKHRFDTQTAAGKNNKLSHAALDATRASLDAAMVRENQKLNSGMVLLTIAISGGPFLGLLGTVVGVMITFAAIAAAGDVNVNAIAPGIAAALVATVAGLIVAIPALFGYNWLSIQIKNVSADTQVFADEFLTKSAEMHSA
jgi:biopolymer transport protein ExbB